MQTEKTNERFFTPPLIIIFITVFIDLLGFGIVIPILTFYANNEPFFASPLEIGLLFSVYSWMQFFFAPIFGRLSDRYGRRPILFISIIGSAVGFLILGLAGTMTALFIGRIVGGITGANISTAQAYIADVTSRENRAKGMGLFGAAFGLGFVLGPAIAGILSNYGVNVPFYFAAALSFANSIALYFLLPESLPADRRTEQKKGNRIIALVESLKDKKFGLVNLVYFLLVTAFSIMTYAFILFTSHRFGYTAVENGYIFAFLGTISIIGQGLLFGRLERRFGELKLTIAGCLMMAISLFVISSVGPTYGGLTALLLVTAFLSFGNAFASPALTSLASRVSNEDEQGKALGIMQSGASLARAIAPMIGGVLLNNAANSMDDLTINRTFVTAAGIMILALAVSIYAYRTIGVSGSNTSVS